LKVTQGHEQYKVAWVKQDLFVWSYLGYEPGGVFLPPGGIF